MPPTIEEIRMAIRQIKSGKVTGPDNIPAEALKSDRSNCKYAPRSIQEDLGGGTSDDRLVLRISHQDTKERSSGQV
ncbi:unnamed protein product [Schistosoma curassoni]|uniref:Reverse transcriptase domain-containing protein n=1 Tax=Schistosoma curassoni TaxID=6186 RepID=A0A183K8F2_9TREM|nr:unnamed protein product [Schistosoma curassoni]